MTRSALAKAASTSPVSIALRKARLSPSSACSTGVLGSSAVSLSVTAGSSCHSISTSSAASSASARVRATTMATGSPSPAGAVDRHRILRRRLHAGEAGQRADPGAGAHLGEFGAGHDLRRTPGCAPGLARVDGEDLGMGERAAHERGMQHARQREVVGVAAAPGDGALGAGARERAADVAVRPVERGSGLDSCRITRMLAADVQRRSSRLRQRAWLRRHRRWRGSRCSGSSCRTGRCGSPRGVFGLAPPAARPPSSACRAYRSRTAARCAATNAACRSAISSAVGQALDGDHLGAVGLHRQHQAAAHHGPSTRTEQAPQTPCSQPRCEPVSPRSVRRKSTRCCRTGTVRVTALAVDGQGDLRRFLAHAALARSAGRGQRALREHALQMQALWLLALPGIVHRERSCARAARRRLAARLRPGLPVMAASRPAPALVCPRCRNRRGAHPSPSAGRR